MNLFSKKTYAAGDKLNTKVIEDAIDDIDAIIMTLKTENRKVVLPIDEIVDTKV